MDSRVYIHNGTAIKKNEFGRFIVLGFAWGDGAGENTNAFKTLGQAKAFIDRMRNEGR